jgi:CheY-like chemotaxis protein
MDVQGILPSYYRYNLDANLRDSVKTPAVKQDYVFIDMVMGMKPQASAVGAPQEIGELKRSLVDDKNRIGSEAPRESDIPLRAVEEISRSATADSAQKYRSFSRLSLLESRRNMEKIVRLIKRQHGECPYTGEKGECTKVFIRCGERSQFSLRENLAEQVMAHPCRYAPGSRGDGVLIVDADSRVREFCKQSLALFLGHVAGDIVATDSPAEAVELMNRGKLSGRRFGLVIVDACLPEGEGYWLIDELFRRNHDVGIILTSEGRTPPKPPKDYNGDVELAPHERFVGATLRKPFHSDELIAALKKLKFR